MATQKKAADKEFAGEQRKSYLAALKIELEGHNRSGNTDRQADVVAEIKRVTGRSDAATSTPQSNTASTPPAKA
ncbi:hypothetical protein ACYX8G_19650 [Microbacterium saperdae]